MKKVLALLLAASLVLMQAASAQLSMTGFGGGFGGTASSSVIKMIQQGSITIASSSASNTYTISPAITTLGNAMLVWNGETTNNTGATDVSAATILVLTNTTTVTATRGTSPAATVTINFTIVEFASGVNSIQAGTINVTATNASATATISAVGANAFVLYQGYNVSASTTATWPQSGVQLTNSTTVTAFVQTSATLSQNVRYMVVDLGSTIVSAVQQVANSDITTGTSTTDTITSVTTANASLMWGGVVELAATLGGDAYNIFLTNSTTVTKTRTGVASTIRTVYYTVVTWASAALNGSIQRTNSALLMSSATSATWTLGSSVSTAKAFVNYNGFSSTGSNPAAALPSLSLASTAVTASLNTSGTTNPAAEVVQFQ